MARRHPVSQVGLGRSGARSRSACWTCRPTEPLRREMSAAALDQACGPLPVSLPPAPHLVTRSWPGFGRAAPCRHRFCLRVGPFQERHGLMAQAAFFQSGLIILAAAFWCKPLMGEFFPLDPWRCLKRRDASGNLVRPQRVDKRTILPDSSRSARLQIGRLGFARPTRRPGDAGFGDPGTCSSINLEKSVPSSHPDQP